MVRIRIDNRVRLALGELPDALVVGLKKEFTYANPEWATKRAIGVPTWGIEPEIRTWRVEGDELSFPRGGYRRVRERIERTGLPTKTLDCRHEGSPCARFPKYVGPELRYYQREALEAAKAKQNCIVRAPTGGGKSLLAIALAADLGLNTLVILPTVALFKQWCDDALGALEMRPSELGVIHQNKRDLRPLTAAVQGTLASRGIDEELRDFFGVVIVDEVQKAGASSYIEAIDPFPAKYRVGISADERRKDRKEFLTHDLFADVAYEISRRDLEQQGFIVDVEIRVVPTDFDAPWFGVVSADDESSEREGVNFVRLVDEMAADEDRNALALEHALAEVEGGQQAIVLSHRREHCQRLDRAFVERGVRSGFFIGGADYAREFDATRAGIKSGAVRVGVGTYGALGVGVNLPSVAAGVAVTPIGGNKQNFNQVRGRLCRLGKASARLYVLWDWKVYPGHLANMIAWNPTVRVLEGGKWVEAEAWRKRHKGKLRRSG
jgi:superfamily II DNA or RNA helicase